MKKSIYMPVAALCAALSLSVPVARADTKTPAPKKQEASSVSEILLVRAQGHPKHADFVALSSKRADLRANVARKGLDATFTEWLRAEHAHVYRQHLEQTARQHRNSGEKQVAAR